MSPSSRITRTLARVCALLLVAFAASARAQGDDSAKGKELYDKIKAATLAGGSADVHALVLKRDRAEMTFDGTFYFAAPVEGHVTCAVFVGNGNFRAEVPPSEFERENVRRLLGSDVVESDFKTAVLRFTDDTFDIVGQNCREGTPADARAQKLASELDERILKETGANLSARVALSLLNAEKPGFFFANFDGGRRGRFSLLVDQQNRIPVANFGLNGGEKGIIFAYQDTIYGNDVWMAFLSLEDYARKLGTYSDVNDLIDITHYDIDADLRDPSSRLRMTARVSAQSRYAGLRAVSFMLGESLPNTRTCA